MATRTVKCAKLKQELPAIDSDTPDGDRALRMALLIGGPTFQQRVRESVSAKAWEMWTDHMRMVVNEYRLDPTTDEANQVLKPHMQAFLFGDPVQLPGYTPPTQS